MTKAGAKVAAAGVLVVAMFVAGCQDHANPGLQIDAIEPAIATSLAATPARILGAHFFAGVRTDLAGSPTTIDATWRVSLDDRVLDASPLDDVTRLDLVVPAGLAVGIYDVHVTSPEGKSATLPGGLTITDEPVGLSLSIEDAPAGSGASVEAALAAGDSLVAYAVARTSAGEFVADVIATWSVEGGIGEIAPSSATAAQFDARSVGVGRLHAHRAAADLAAASGEIRVAPGPARSIMIVDQPGSAGTAIEARADLTTDTDGALHAYAISLDAFGNFVTDEAVAWSLVGLIGSLPGAAGAAAVVDFSSPGVGTLVASHSTLIGDSTGVLTVSPGRAATLVVAPETVSMTADAVATAFGVTATDADGNTTTNLGVIAWSIGTGPIRAIDPVTGVLTPTAAGTGTVRATSSHGPADTSGVITIMPGRVVSFAIAPDTATMTADDPALAFTVGSAADADGNATGDLGTITWTVDSGAITALSATTGILSPATAGTGAIRASSNYGASDVSGAITIAPGRAATVTISPDTLTTVQRAVATAFSTSAVDSDGNPTSDLGVLTWSVASGPISVINAGSGLFTPITAGAGTLRVTSSYGPTDVTGAIVVLREATLVASRSAPTNVTTGQTFAVALRVTNTGESDATGVTPALGITGMGSATISTGPTPASATVLAGTFIDFAYAVVAGATGTVELSGSAAGFDGTTGNAVMAPAAVASVVVQSPPALSISIAIPQDLVLGNVFAATLTVTNNGGATATGVSPALPILAGTGNANYLTGPIPANATIPGGGGTASFTVNYQASAIGDLDLTGGASGTDANSGAPVTAPATTSNVANILGGVVLVAPNPFADSTGFAYVFGHNGRVYVGPRANGAGAVSFLPDGSAPASVGFSFPRDTTGSNSSRNTAPLTPPYSSIGQPGCTAAACGPDDETGRGLFGAATLAGTSWIVLGGTRSGSDFDYVYMSTTTSSPLGFRYVDLSSLLGGNTHGFSAMHAFNDRLYLGFVDAAGGSRPYLISLLTTPPSPGLDAVGGVNVIDLNVSNLTNFGFNSPAMVDAITDFTNRLYIANAGGCYVSINAAPTSDADFVACTPSSAAYTGKTSVTTAKLGDLEPADRAIPQFATLGSNLYMARNTTLGPQLWRCDPLATGLADRCDPADWSLVAANTTGTANLSQFNNPANTRISMLTAVNGVLFIGFDNAVDGIVMMRSTTAIPTSRADFAGEAGCVATGHPGTCQGLGGNGLSIGANRIFDAKALDFGGQLSTYLVVGGGGTLNVYRLLF